MSSQSLPRHYFEALYEADADPWKFATKAYERQKYAATLEHLPRARYRNALELGCSIGVLTAQLAARCARLTALDAAQKAADAARARCAVLDNVEVLCATLPDQFPGGKFELILVSEVGYYFSKPDLKRLQRRILEALSPAGDVVLVHYLPEVPDYPLSGDEVHQAFFELPELEHLSGFRAERYRFDAWRKAVSTSA